MNIERVYLSPQRHHTGAYEIAFLYADQGRTVLRNILAVRRPGEPWRPVTLYPLHDGSALFGTLVNSGLHNMPDWLDLPALADKQAGRNIFNDLEIAQ